MDHKRVICGSHPDCFMGHIRIALWVSGSSGSAGVTHFQPCYEDYLSQGQLLPRDADKITLDRFVCGSRSKTGLLCGNVLKDIIV